MSGQLKSALVVILIALVAAALLACDQEPTLPPTPEPTIAAVPTATASPEPTPTATPTPIPTAEPTATPTPKPAITAVPTATATPEPTPTATPTPEPEATATPEPEVDAPLPFDSLVVRGTLSNGMSYYIRHNEEPRDRAHISLVVKAGSVHEEESQRGMAHLVEHMAFNGTERFEKQEIIDYLESIGSGFGTDLNARTGFDDTLYFLRFRLTPPRSPRPLSRFSATGSYAISFDPEEIELERDVVLEEWRLYQGFNSRLQDNLLQLLFGSSLYTHRSPIGLPGSH